MEIIEVSGYTIRRESPNCKEALTSKADKGKWSGKSDIQLPMATIEKVVEQYTNESGVRGLEKGGKNC